VLIVSNIKENGQPIGLGDAGHFWHSDLSYKEKPSLGSMLHAQELPNEGGDTLFANQHRPGNACPSTEARAIRRSAEHTYLAKYEELRAAEPVAAQAHAGADRRGEARGAAGGAHASRDRPQGAVRQRAFHHAHRRPAGGREPRAAGGAVRAQHPPEFVYRHHWQPHDMVFWDNRSLMHLAAGTPDHLRRKLYRTTIEGDTPVSEKMTHAPHHHETHTQGRRIATLLARWLAAASPRTPKARSASPSSSASSTCCSTSCRTRS
jgi:taurine dioxygenase